MMPLPYKDEAPSIREKALNAALEINRGRAANAEAVISTAREIEAYLNGDDAKAQSGSGESPHDGATLGNFPQTGSQQVNNLANYGKAIWPTQ